MESKAIVLVSGGMDSCVTAAIASLENDDLAFLHVSYGQRTEDRERKAFNDIPIITASKNVLISPSSILPRSAAHR